MSTLNDEIRHELALTKHYLRNSNDLNCQSAADAIEKLILQHEIDLLTALSNYSNHETQSLESYCENKISELTNQLKAL